MSFETLMNDNVFWIFLIGVAFGLKSIYIDYRMEMGIAILWSLSAVVIFAYGFTQNVQGEER